MGARADILAGRSFVELYVKNSQFNRALENAERRLKSFGSSVFQVGVGLLKIGGVGAAGFGLALKTASELQETMGKFNTVFGDQSADMEKWATSTADAMGVSKEAMARMLSGLQDLFVPMGMAPDKAANLSQELSKLAIDLGSFNNMSSDDVMRDLTAAMTGSGETMKKYGVIVDEAAVKQELLNQGLDPKKVSNSEKAMARYQIIMRGTTAAQGDAERTAGSFANQMKRLWAAVDDVLGLIGQAFIDDVASLVGQFVKAAKSVRDFVKDNQQLIATAAKVVAIVLGVGVAIAGIGASIIAVGSVIGGVSAILAGIASAIAFVQSMFVLAGAAIAALLSPIGLIVAGIVALGATMVDWGKLWNDIIGFIQQRFGPLVETIKNSFTAIKNAVASGNLAEAWEIITDSMEAIWLDLTNGIREWWDSAMNYVTDAAAAATKGIGSLFESLGEMLEKMLDAYASYYDTVYNFVTEQLGNATGVRTLGDPSGSAFESNFGSSIDDAIANLGEFGRNLGEVADENAEHSKKDRAQRAKERQERLAELRKNISERAAEVRKQEAFAIEAPGAAGIGANPFGDGGSKSTGGKASVATSSARALIALGQGSRSEEKIVQKLDEVNREAIENAIQVGKDIIETMKSWFLIHQ